MSTQSSGRSSEYIIKKAYKELPQGAFVRPVQFQYLSRERKEEFQLYNPRIEAVCYTSKGYMLIPLDIIKEIS